MNNSIQHYNVVIIGTGLAGYTLAREYRKLSPDSSLLMLTRDDGAWYSKPMLSNGLAKNKSARDLAMKSATEMAESLDATVLDNTTVQSIDPEVQTLTTEKTTFQYDALVLACGAQQLTLPIEGDGVADVLTVNDLADYAVFRDKLEDVSRVAVMGPGLIGCEFANDLANVGKITIIIGPDSRPLERLIPPEASSALRQALDEYEVEWHLETVVTSIDRSGSQYLLTLASGAVVEAGLVLSAAGLKPDIALAQNAGLKTNQGIVVDRLFQTSEPSIYALGDCIELNGMVMPYIMPIMHGAKALSKTLVGTPTEVVFPAMPVAIKTPVHPVVVAPPPPGSTGQWTTETLEAGVRSLFHDNDDMLIGFVLTGKLVKEKTALERQLPKLLT